MKIKMFGQHGVKAVTVQNMRELCTCIWTCFSCYDWYWSQGCILVLMYAYCHKFWEVLLRIALLANPVLHVLVATPGQSASL